MATKQIFIINQLNRQTRQLSVWKNTYFDNEYIAKDVCLILNANTKDIEHMYGVVELNSYAEQEV